MLLKIYKEILEMYYDPENVREWVRRPFLFQDETKNETRVCATDSYALVSLPIIQGMGGLKELEDGKKKNLGVIINPKLWDTPEEITVVYLEAVMDSVPSVEEWEESDDDCDTCDGSNYVECDMGEEHECPDCTDGKTSRSKKTGRMIEDNLAKLKFKEVCLGLRFVRMVVDTAKLLGKDTVTALGGNEQRNPFKFLVGEAEIIVMPTGFTSCDKTYEVIK